MCVLGVEALLRVYVPKTLLLDDCLWIAFVRFFKSVLFAIELLVFYVYFASTGCIKSTACYTPASEGRGSHI